LGVNATESEIDTPLDGALVQLTEFRELEAIGDTTISANQWAALGGIAETLAAAELDILDGATVVTAELNYLDIAVLGTGAASKAVVLDGSGNYTAPAGTWDLSGVTAITLRAGEIVTADIAGDQITNALVADDQIDSEHYVAASIDNEHLANDAVDSDELAAGSVDLAHLSAGAKFQSLISDNLSDTATPHVLTAAETTNKVISNYDSSGEDRVFTMPAPHAAGNVIFPIGDEFQVDIEPDTDDLFYLNGTAMAANEHIQNTADTLGERIVGYCVNINGTLRWMFYSGDAAFVEETP